MGKIIGGSYEDMLDSMGMSHEEYESAIESEGRVASPPYDKSFRYTIGSHYQYNGIVVECLRVPDPEDDSFFAKVVADKNNLLGVGYKGLLGRGFYTPVS